MYLICNFSIKPLACVVFDPDCLKRSYGVNHTVESVDKVVKCYARTLCQDYGSYYSYVVTSFSIFIDIFDHF